MSGAGDKRAPVSLWAATVAIAGLTWLRMLRGKAMWATAILGLLSLGVAAAKPDSFAITRWATYLQAGGMPLLLISIALLLSGGISEEIENKTSTYLWSRPIPRYAVATGKLLTAIPLLAIVFGVAAGLAFYVIGKGQPLGPTVLLVRGIAGIAVLTVSGSIAAITIGSLLPKQAAAATIGYFAVDIFLGALPLSIAKISMSRHARTIAGTTDDNLVLAVITLVALTAIWGAILIARLSKSNLGAAR